MVSAGGGADYRRAPRLPAVFGTPAEERMRRTQGTPTLARTQGTPTLARTQGTPTLERRGHPPWWSPDARAVRVCSEAPLAPDGCPFPSFSLRRVGVPFTSLGWVSPSPPLGWVSPSPPGRGRLTPHRCRRDHPPTTRARVRSDWGDERTTDVLPGPGPERRCGGHCRLRAVSPGGPLLAGDSRQHPPSRRTGPGDLPHGQSAVDGDDGVAVVFVREKGRSRCRQPERPGVGVLDGTLPAAPALGTDGKWERMDRIFSLPPPGR